jgi:hypothetical protein
LIQLYFVGVGGILWSFGILGLLFSAPVGKNFSKDSNRTQGNVEFDPEKQEAVTCIWYTLTS